ncbi:hypothetical protein IAT38_008341 [Cryptococcus sp. DSM 104549]
MTMAPLLPPPRALLHSLCLTTSGRCATRGLASSSRASAKAPAELLRLASLGEESEHAMARAWVDGFTEGDIPKDSWVATRSRSSGPGGQHVNKTESKVTIRCDLKEAQGKWLPAFVMPALTKSPHYHPSPPTLLITSQQTRTASANQAHALALLHSTIASAAAGLIINPTSESQRKRVKDLEKREKARRMEMKKRQSMKKAGRRE